MNIARWAFTVSLTTFMLAPLAARSALAQDQDNSVAAAARRAQEQKKDQAKAAHVYDNDSLPSKGVVNVVGQEPAAGSSSQAAGSTQSVAPKPAPSAKEVAGLNADLDKAKQRVADLKADLDVVQRKYALDQSTYLSNPNHSSDRAGAASLDSEKSDIDAKAEAVAAAEKELAAAQAKADEAAKEAAAAAAQEKAAQSQAASSAQQQPPPAPAAPSSQPATTPDSDTATVNR